MINSRNLIYTNILDLTFNSFNDPFNCNEKQGRSLFNHLGGTLILRNDGHFTQKELPLLMTLLQQY